MWHTATLSGTDGCTAYQLLGRILQHESRQQGFDLAATQDADFHEQPPGPGHQHSVGADQWSEGGTAQLLQHLEGYFSNVARNVQRTYLRPFVIVTANMILAVDIFDKLNFRGATVPRFDAIQEEFPRELQSSVSFPADFFKPPEEKEGPLGRPAGQRTMPQTT
ncbi:cadherin EGF LAG seven-pass G-type receptor 1-like [Callithrix jacchus]